MLKLKFENTVHKQRFALGVICGLLPILCTLFGLLSCTYGDNPIYILNSISETYYSNHKIIMVISLGLCTFFFATYHGYDLGDRIFTILSAVGALGVAAFPCSSSFYNLDYVGLFSLPIKVSNIIHFISAFLVFGSFTLMTLTQFTKGTDKTRNKIYYICGAIMGVALLGIVVIPNFPFRMMILEFIMLEAFAVAWITKSKVKISNTTE